jgi:hypothetical protein
MFLRNSDTAHVEFVPLEMLTANLSVDLLGLRVV